MHSCALAGEHLCAAPGGDGDCGQRSQEVEDADAQQQPGEPDWNTDLVSREGPGCSGCEIYEIVFDMWKKSFPVKRMRHWHRLPREAWPSERLVRPVRVRAEGAEGIFSPRVTVSHPKIVSNPS